MTAPFDFYTYIASLTTANRLAQEHGFRPTTASGIHGLEEPLARYRTTANFVVTSDICDEAAFLRSGGWFKRRSVMIFLLARCRPDDEAHRREKMTLCRELLRQLHSRILHDAEHLAQGNLYIDTTTLRSSELGGAFLTGCTGLSFLLAIDEPTDLCYQPSEWTTP